MDVSPATLVATDATQDRLDAYWDSRAQAYHQHQTTGERARRESAVWAAALASVLPAAPASVLDMGTGTGYIAHLLAGAGHEVTGVDTSEGMLGQARRHAARARAAGLPAARFLRGDALSPDPAAGPFEVVTSRYLLWTLRYPLTAVRAWLRMLTPGGLIVAMDANHFPHGMDSITHVESEAGPGAFVRTYDADTRAQLPLAHATSSAPYAELFSAAGLIDVRVCPLSEILDLDRRHGVSPGHSPIEPFLVVGRRGV